MGFPLSQKPALVASASCKPTLKGRASFFARSSSPKWKPIPQLQHDNVQAFRNEAFVPRLPHVLSSFHLPATKTWVSSAHPPSLNSSHLRPYASTAFLPIELTSPAPPLFQRVPFAPLSLFLDYADLPPDKRGAQRFYVAQAPLDALPEALRKDFPTPRLAQGTGRGDIYGTSLWMSMGGSVTPLHRDPNPNLLIQVAGTKIARLLPETEGGSVLRAVRQRMGQPIDTSGRFRGEEMMADERIMLDEEIWSDMGSFSEGFEAVLQPGDGLFIPDGWWHAIRGDEAGLNISVNWWFR